MSFTAPLQLAWLGLLVPLVVLYILRRRRERRRVGSTLLWESALRDLRAESPFRRLVPHLSLLLQALVIILGALALARPSGAARLPEGAQLAIVVDTSLSMGAPPEGQAARQAPIERARRYLLQRAGSLPTGARVLVVAAGTSPALLSPLTADRAALTRAADALGVTCPVADLDAAIDLAAERLVGAPAGSEIVLLSDLGRGVDLAGRGLPVRLHAPAMIATDGSEPRDNSALIAADARPDAASDEPDRVEVFASVAHYGEAPRELFVTASALYEADLTGGDALDALPLLASQRVVVAPDSPTQLVLRASLPPDAAGRAPFVLLRLSAADGDAGTTAGGQAQDALAADDVVVLPSPGRQRLPVFMVGDVPNSVARVLETDENVELFRTTLARLAAEGADAPRLDGLVVYGGELPEEPPGGATLVVRPSGDAVFGTPLGPRAESALVTRWQEDDPLLRFVTLADIELADVRPLGSDVRALVSTARGVAIGVLPRVDGDITIVSADTDRGPWARTPGFVIFFRNLLEQARAQRAAGGIATGEVGEALRVVARDGLPVSVLTPEGRTLEASSHAGVALVPVPPVAGAFVVRVGDHAQVGLRHVLRAEASDLRPRAPVDAGAGEAGEAGAAERASPSGPDTVAVESALHPFFALALLLVCALEVAWATRKGAA